LLKIVRKKEHFRKEVENSFEKIEIVEQIKNFQKKTRK